MITNVIVQTKMKILVDAMGGDNAPDAVIKGAAAAINQIDAEVCLIGQEAVINTRSRELLGKQIKDIVFVHFLEGGSADRCASSQFFLVCGSDGGYCFLDSQRWAISTD